MKRRNFLITTTAAMSWYGYAALAGETMAYTPEVFAKAKASNKAVLLDFFAPWCSTCRTQERVIGKLRAENPAYDEAIHFVQVDWDTHKDGDLVKAMKIPRRSTLVLLEDGKETGRIVAGTSEADIMALLDKAL